MAYTASHTDNPSCSSSGWKSARKEMPVAVLMLCKTLCCKSAAHGIKYTAPRLYNAPVNRRRRHGPRPRAASRRTIKAGEVLLYAPAAAQLDGSTRTPSLQLYSRSLRRARINGYHHCRASPTARLVATTRRAPRSAPPRAAVSGDCAFVRSVGQARGRADQRWARSFVVANALRVKSGHLRRSHRSSRC